MNPKQDLDPRVAGAYVLTGQWVDEQVAQGRSLEDVLAEGNRRPGQRFWFQRELLRDYSKAVAAAAA